jgi:hypothetical protein
VPPRQPQPPAGEWPQVERRVAARRVLPVEEMPDPPVLERRRGPDRRTSGRDPATAPGDLTERTGGAAGDGAASNTGARSAPWSHGWLVFEAEGAPPGALRDVRRLAPIPVGWETCHEEELLRHHARAVDRSEARRSGAPGDGGATGEA